MFVITIGQRTVINIVKTIIMCIKPGKNFQRIQVSKSEMIS